MGQNLPYPAFGVVPNGGNASKSEASEHSNPSPQQAGGAVRRGVGPGDGSSKMGEVPLNRMVKLPPVILRELARRDREQLVALHDECFPVSYETQFYDKAVDGKLFSTAATIMGGQLTPGDDRPSGLVGYAEELAAVIISQIDLSDKFEDAVLESPAPGDMVSYICTLGVWHKFRKHGLAARLLDTLIEHVQARDEVKAITLHVLTTNRVAMHFYEGNGFSRLRMLEDFYTIGGKPCNAFLYVRYFHGGAPPAFWAVRLFRNIKGPIIDICSRLACSLWRVAGLGGGVACKPTGRCDAGDHASSKLV